MYLIYSFLLILVKDWELVLFFLNKHNNKNNG